jgi:hypothetical protein
MTGCFGSIASTNASARIWSHESPRTLSINNDAVLWADVVLGQPKGAPAATVAPLVLRRAKSPICGARQARRSLRRAHRRGPEAVPVVRPPASRNVVVPLASMVAVPVVRPEPSRNVRVPFESVVTVPVMRPLASRNVVDCCADAPVTVASVSTAMVSVLIA